MTIAHHHVPEHWNYFLTPEEDIQNLSRWIEFTENNQAVYSIELARLLMTAAAEADVVAKAFCKKVRPGSRADNIIAYRKLLMEKAPLIAVAQVAMPRYDMTFAHGQTGGMEPSLPTGGTETIKSSITVPISLRMQTSRTS